MVVEPLGNVSDITEINFETVVNLWERVRAALERSRGSFLVVASQSALVSENGNGVYCASKAALAGWLRGIDASTPVRLRLIHPGGTRTPLLERGLRGMAAAQHITYEEFVHQRYSPSPAGRIAEPHEVGEAIVWASNLKSPALMELLITGGEVLA